MTTTTTPMTIHSLKTARGRKTGAVIHRAGGRMTTTTTDGDVWASIACGSDGGHDGVEVFQPGGVADAPAMGPATFACTLHWRHLERIVRAVVPATDTESSRYALGGVQIECREGSMLAAIATDGRRLHAAHLQPASIAGETPQYCVVPAAMWTRLATVSRAAVRSCRSLTPRQAAEALWQSRVTIKTDGTVVCLTMTQGDLSVAVTARLIEGRFPRWRDSVDPLTSVGEGFPVDAGEVAAEMAVALRVHRAAVVAGRAAWLAEPLPPRSRQRKAKDYKHPRGVWLRRNGMQGRGCDWRSDVAAAPAEVLLDPEFVLDAMTAAVQFGRVATVRQGGEQGERVLPIMIEGGGEFGERVVAVIMPMAAD